MPDLNEISDDLVDELTPIAADAPDVCPLCRSGRHPDHPLCWSCNTTTSQVSHPCPVIIPISYYRTPSPLRERMHDFKQHPSPDVVTRERANVAALLVRYLIEHRDGLHAQFGPWDTLVAVPSTHHDNPPALQQAVEDNFGRMVDPFLNPLVRGPTRLNFNKAAPDGFLQDGRTSLAGRQLLLIDDTFTTGARVHSAHHTLTEAGARPVGAIVVTRKINPSHANHTQDLWDRQSSRQFSWTTHPWWHPDAGDYPTP